MNQDAPYVCILVDRPRFSAHAAGRILYGWEMSLIEERAKRAGLLPSQIKVISISPSPAFPSVAQWDSARERINAEDFSCIIPLDEIPLRFTTERTNIRKYHLSPLDSREGFRCQNIMPSFHPDQIRKDMTLGLYLEMAIGRAAKAPRTGWPRAQNQFHIYPSTEEAIEILRSVRDKPWHSLDLETGRNQINTFGVAWSETEAIAVKCLPDSMSPQEHYALWSAIRDICESDSQKIAQNGIYERMYLSRYGVHVNNFSHDTMCAMRFLYPELEKGLGNVGRVYTNEIYWKDTGKEESSEGGKKDWGDIRDWDQHGLYNCLDTSKTLLAAMNQRKDLEARGLMPLWENYVRKLFDPTYEMSALGLPLNEEKRTELLAEHEARAAELLGQLSNPVNPKSPKQKIQFFKDKGIKLPNKKNKVTGKLAPSTDELSLKKVRLKYPEDPDIPLFLEIAKIEKQLSSYLRVQTLPDKRIRFGLDPFATETGRMACKKDVWDMGFNAQTMGKKTKAMIELPEESGLVFLEIDLSQAESRFVAYDSCESTLLGMLERKEDIHKYVAAEIYNKPMSEITHEERQLGKKSGHGANYSMGVRTFQDSCLKEMDLVLDAKMAERALESYHRAFPGIRRWHNTIRETLYRERKLTNPFGFTRYFYGRLDDNTFREAYAFKPQSTIPAITNHLMFALADMRKAGKFNFQFNLQVHDSLYLTCTEPEALRIAEYASELKNWHPEVILPAGQLLIPVDYKVGRNLKEMK